MKTFLKIVLGLAVLAAVAFAVVMFVTSGSRDVAKAFVTEASSGAFSEARAHFHEALAAEISEERLAGMFADVRPYTEVSFGSVEAGASGTRLEGRAETADGCSSSVVIELIDDRIVSFSITPLCRR